MNTIQGQSFIFNALFIVLNLTGLTFVTIGFHENFQDSKWLYAGIGFGVMLISIVGLIILKGRLFMSLISRYLVGSLFIVSGLIKANDPVGFSYKLKEYFEDGALAYRIKEWFGMPGFSLEFLIDWALFLSVIICVAEIVIGVLLLIGGKIKLVAWLLILMMLFFTFLTWHTANCNPDTKFVDRDTYEMSDPLGQMKLEEAKTNTEIKIISQNSKELVVEEMKSPQCVSDCGCFGDAMKGSVGRSLTPKESLWKDIVLVYLSIWIFITQFKIKPNTKQENSYMIPISLLIIAFFSYIFSWYLPVVFGLISILSALWILRAGGKFFGNYFGSTLIVCLLCFAITSYVQLFEPIKDYRPYAVGSNLYQKMHDGKDGKYESGFILKNLKTGKNEFFTQAQYTDTARKIWEDKNYKYVSTDTKEIIPTRLPSITGQFNPVIQYKDLTKAEQNFPYIMNLVSKSMIPGYTLLDIENQNLVHVPENEYNLNDYDTAFFKMKEKTMILDPKMEELSVRDYIVEAKQLMIIFSKQLSEVKDKKKIAEFSLLFAQAKKHKIPMILICSSDRNEINAWRKKYKFDIPTFTNDETELKAVSRSNPSLMVVQSGVVKGKYPFRSLPSFEWLKKHVLK